VSYGYSMDPPPAGAARLLFVDGGMNYASARRYELLDLTTLRAFVGLRG